MIKVIIAINNDILFDSLSDIALKNEGKIEIINVPHDNLSSLIYHIRRNENLIVLDSTTSVTFCKNILKNAINQQAGKGNIIILVIDSNSITNIINQEKCHSYFFKKKQTDLSLLEVATLVSKSLRETLEIEEKVDSILRQIGFASSFKGYNYIKDSILLAYTNKKLLLDTKALVKKVAEKNNVLNDKVVRSDMDRVLNTVMDSIDKSVLYDIFGNEYDGRKVSLKYFIDLCIRYLEKQRYCCFN